MPPIIRGVGTVHEGDPISPGLPAGTVAGDLLVMIVDSASPITADGWLVGPEGSVAQHNDVGYLTVLYRVASGDDDATTTASVGHTIGQIVGIEAGTFDPDNIFNASASAVLPWNINPCQIPGSTTTVDGCLILACGAWGADTALSNWTNADLASITEYIDAAPPSGKFGTIGMAAGVKETAGVYGTTTVQMSPAERGAGMSVAIAPLSATPPAAPGNPAAVAISTSQIDITWDDVADETGYRVERSPDGVSGWADASGNLAADATSHLDSGLDPATEYFYRVVAFNVTGDSDPSAVVSATTDAESGGGGERSR